MLKKMLMVAEGEGAGGASGPGAGAAPGGVSGPAAPAGGGSTPFPHILGGGDKPAAGASPAGGGGAGEDELDAAIAADAEGRGIPHDRVRSMRGSWEKRAAEQARQQMMRELQPVLQELQQLRGLRQELDPAAVKTGIAKSILQALGVEEEKPQPKYLTAEEVEARLRKDREEWNHESQLRDDMRQAHAELTDRKVKYAKQFQHFPWIEEVAAAVWGTRQAIENRISFGAIVDGLVKQLEGGIGKWNEAYLAAKREDQEEQPITPGSGPAPGAKKPEKVDNSPEALAKRSRDARLKLMQAGG